MVFAQKHDYHWTLGGNNPILPQWAGTVIDFTLSPPDIYYEFKDMHMRQVNASICDNLGNLLFYTNGIYIANTLGEIMENGQGLNPGEEADMSDGYGYILDQGAMALPWPEHDSLFLLLHMDKQLTPNQNSFQSAHFYYTLINMNRNNGLGAVIEKNQAFITDFLHKGKVVATRHANGRDWWLLIRRYGTNTYHRILLAPTGLINKGLEVEG